ncbi:CoB--CoM heterodisulfide reductase iron-sulfur subunit B family protein [Anoxynatronum buryatiense]|uniref:Heterodisulfide reductase subunit B n=1 Tax=Anoxynatronum buryatiense TaxID=489973 RepID=A0AA46AKF3_9CLOT|nr:CoB--CoM heterodisulfide reductase iron-sulfur subunit B family protein [Anoxynatronum buryatiense]SMP69258.1 heterodisulfide reductase subunit B [Anoxynatronum buryatiense]
MLSYYPGCTVRAQQDDGFEREALALLASLDIQTHELEEWECCGAVYPEARDEYVGLLSSVRALQRTWDAGSQGMLTLCSACFHVMRRVNHRMKRDEEAQRRVGGYLGNMYQGETKVFHLLEVLRDLVGYPRIQEAVVTPLKGEKMACYYGCMLLRPKEELGLVDSENPRLMEALMETLGATTVRFPYQTDCCGAYHVYREAPLAAAASLKVITAAREAGATQIITACPLCKHNLEACQASLPQKERLPVAYMTAPLVKALGGVQRLEQMAFQNGEKGDPSHAFSGENSQ